MMSVKEIRVAPQFLHGTHQLGPNSPSQLPLRTPHSARNPPPSIWALLPACILARGGMGRWWAAWPAAAPLLDKPSSRWLWCPTASSRPHRRASLARPRPSACLPPPCPLGRPSSRRSGQWRWRRFGSAAWPPVGVLSPLPPALLGGVRFCRHRRTAGCPFHAVTEVCSPLTILLTPSPPPGPPSRCHDGIPLSVRGHGAAAALL